MDKAIDNPETLPVGETLGLAKKRAKYLRRHISLEQRIISNEKEEKKKRAVAADEPLPKMKWYDAQEADAQEADAQEANDQQEANKQEANQQELTHEDYVLRSAVDDQVRMVCADIHAIQGRLVETPYGIPLGMESLRASESRSRSRRIRTSTASPCP